MNLIPLFYLWTCHHFKFHELYYHIKFFELIGYHFKFYKLWYVSYICIIHNIISFIIYLKSNTYYITHTMYYTCVLQSENILLNITITTYHLMCIVYHSLCIVKYTTEYTTYYTRESNTTLYMPQIYHLIRNLLYNTQYVLHTCIIYHSLHT